MERLRRLDVDPRRARLWAIFSVAAVVVAGCGPDAGLAAVAVTPGEPLDITAEVLSTEPTSFVAGLPGEVIVLSIGRELSRIDRPMGAPRLLGADGGRVVDVLPIGRGASAQVLVAAERGLFAIVAGILERSPVDAALGGAAPVRLLDTGTSDAPRVWIVTAIALHRWSDGGLSTIGFDAPGFDRATARYAARRAFTGGASGLWIAPAGSPDGLAWFLPDDGAPASTLRLGAPIEGIAADASGALLAATADGTLHVVRPDFARARYALPSPVRAVHATPGSTHGWIATDAGLYHLRDGVFRPVRAALDPYGSKGGALPALRVPDVAGPLLVAGPGGVARLRPDELLELRGVPARVSSAVEIEVVAPHPERLAALTATLDGAAQLVDTAARRVAIDPWSVTPGPRTLVVTARYTQGEPLVAEAAIVVEEPFAPTWSRAIAPLFRARCEKCHKPSGSAHTLDTAEAWRAEVDTVIGAVTDGRMPLPPNPRLSGAEIVTLRGWRAGGFQP